MQRILEFLIRYLDFIYLDRSSRFVDSKTTGNRHVDAWIAVETGRLRWVIYAERDQVRLNVGTSLEKVSRWTYHTSLIRQFLEGGPERDDLLDERSARWVRENLDRIAAMFADEQAVTATCTALDTLKSENVMARPQAQNIRRT